MPFLNDPHGLYPVGASQCLVPVDSPMIVGNANIPGQEEAGLRLDEVAFTVFYPANAPLKRRRGLHWLTGPLKVEVAGLAHFLGVSRWIISLIVYIYGQFVKLPVYQDAPMLKPAEHGAKWPLVVFSHGLGGSPTTYSQFCTRLAASGRVVVAMAHRDGTMPSCIVPYQGQKRPLLYIKESDVQWVDKPEDVMPLRTDQLIIRQHEIYTAYAAITKLAYGGDGASTSFRFVGGEKSAPIDIEDICLAGHSFGGCTMFTILSSSPPPHPSLQRYPRLPVRDAIILDPWLEPFPTPGPTPFSSTPASLHGNAEHIQNGNGSIDYNNTRLLVINSEAFTLWTSHFKRLAGVVNGWNSNAKLVTLVQAAHISFSDYRLFPLIGNKASARLMDVISQLSISFLDRQSDPEWSVEEALRNAGPGVQILKDAPKKIVVGKFKDGSDKYRWIGEAGQVITH